MAEGGVACVYCLDEVEEGRKRDFVVESVIQDDTEVVFIERYVKEPDRGYCELYTRCRN